MPPVCTPEKFNNVQCANIDNGQQFQEFITPPLNTNKNLVKKSDLIYMEKMQQDLPILSNIFDIHKKIGEGTFSTVFLATLHNDPESEKCFAIKYLVPTTHPKRIEVELKCLKQIGGTDNVAGIDLCLREKDNIAFVMPYLQHDHFTDYAKDMTVEEIALYIKNILIALRRVHSFGIIHRDVKPNNFLYDRTNKKFLLIDFGLAQLCSSTQTPDNIAQKRKRENDETDVDLKSKIEPARKRQALLSKNINSLTSVLNHLQKCENNGSSCKENISATVENYPAIFKEPLFKSPIKINTNNVRSIKKSPFKFPGLDLPPTHSSMLNKKEPHQRRLFDQDDQVNLKNKLNKLKTNLLENDRFGTPSIKSSTSRIELKRDNKEKHYCKCYGKPKICNICIVRKAQEASRAGTPGFRPPEVLLKYDKQTTAVDIWAVGVIMLSLLSKSYTFFHAPDDISALAEIITLFGDEQVKKLAKIFGCDLICSEKKSKLDLRKICCRLRSRGKPQTNKSTIRCIVCANYMHVCVCPGTLAEDMEDIFPASAYDLLERLLDINPFTRITAAQALNHPFLIDM